MCFFGTSYNLQIINCIKEFSTLAVKVRSWTNHFSQSCSQRHLLVSFCKPPNSSPSLQCSGSGKSSYWFPKFEQFVRTNGSVPPNLRSREKRKAGRKVLLSCWKVKKMHQKHIWNLVYIYGRANPSKNVSCNQFSLSWGPSKIPHPLSGGHRTRLRIRTKSK